MKLAEEIEIRSDKTHLELKGMSYLFDSESLFPPNLKELGENFFNEKKVSQDNMMRYLWAVRYSPLFIRMCVIVRDKVKNGMYDFLAKTFH